MNLTEKQKQVLNFIISYSKQRQSAPTQREIKDYFHLKSFGSVQKYLKYLASAGFIETDWNARRGIKIKSVGMMEGTIPFLGPVAAGHPLEIISSPDVPKIHVPPTLLKSGQEYFALEVRGDSMIEAGILEGDTAICRFTPTAHNGEKVVAVLNNQATIKFFYKEEKQIKLLPANKNYSPIIITEDSGDFSIAGVLIGIMRSYA